MGGRSCFGFTLRPATKDDLDEITRVHIAGFTEEPQVHYCYPFRHQYPQDHWRWTRYEYGHYLEQPNKYLVHMLDAPLEIDGSVVVKPVALAVWNLAVLTAAKAPDLAEKDRKDADKRRCEAFFGRAGQRFKTYFAKWAEKQVNLASLVVHPNFRLRGGGSMLVRWGMNVADDKGWPVTLCASPMGRFLYEYLGFKTIASEVVQVEGEQETLTSTVMVYCSGKET
ncbi:acyl-CoA N-acyltransferase [Cadophora sp. DSE1049]|nr:acyl-CoA N-acyltransferase [Cadophora sp. DSE1049]